MNNKKGFTLVEVAIVIAIIGLLAIAVLPRISDVFGDSVNKTMKIQENEVKDAATIYLEDYCRNPFGSRRCTLTRNSDLTYSGTINLSSLISDEYIDDISLQGVNCTGSVSVDHDDMSVCLRCGDAYTSSSCGGV